MLLLFPLFLFFGHLSLSASSPAEANKQLPNSRLNPFVKVHLIETSSHSDNRYSTPPPRPYSTPILAPFQIPAITSILPTPTSSPASALDQLPSADQQQLSLFRVRPVLASLIALLVIALIGATLLGNLMVCVAIALVRKLKAQPANLLLISLAVADFCVGLFVMPMAAVYLLNDQWPFGSFLCRFWVTADLTLCTASILNLCMISVDRHLAVTRALRYSAIRTRRRICAYISVVWLGALLVSAAPLALLPFRGTENECQVPQNRFYQIYATIIAFWGPALIMVIVYFKLWSAAKRMQLQDRMVLRWQGAQQQQHLNGGRNRESGESATTTEPILMNGTAPQEGDKCNNNNDQHVIRSPRARFMFALRQSMQHEFRHPPNEANINNNESVDSGRPRIISLRAGSALANAIRIPLLGSSASTTSSSSAKPHGHPHQHEDKARKTLGVIMSVFIFCWVPFFILALLKSQRVVLRVPQWLDSLALWLGYSNSMLNPLIYAKYNREFRIPFREMLCCRFATIQDVMRNESYYVKFGSPRSRAARCRHQSTASVIAQRNGAPALREATRSYSGQNCDGEKNRSGRQKSNGGLAVRAEVAKRNSSPGALLQNNKSAAGERRDPPKANQI